MAVKFKKFHPPTISSPTVGHYSRGFIYDTELCFSPVRSWLKSSSARAASPLGGTGAYPKNLTIQVWPVCLSFLIIIHPPIFCCRLRGHTESHPAQATCAISRCGYIVSFNFFLSFSLFYISLSLCKLDL